MLAYQPGTPALETGKDYSMIIWFSPKSHRLSPSESYFYVVLLLLLMSADCFADRKVVL